MRTKTLLIAAAALAVGIVSSKAQVYSQNIVGYANVPTLNGGLNYLLECPFTLGASNGVNEVFGTNLPDFSQVVTWDVGNQTYKTSEYDSSEPTTGVRWYESDDQTPLTTLPTIPPGTGFFLNPGGSVTNLFAGSVAVLSGGTNTMSLPNGGINYLVGSTIPFTGFVTNVNVGTSVGINMNGLPDFTQVILWDSVGQNYVVREYDSTQPVTGDNWYLSDDGTPADCPSLSVGQGFFLNLGGSYTWTQSLPAN